MTKRKDMAAIGPFPLAFGFQRSPVCYEGQRSKCSIEDEKWYLGHPVRMHHGLRRSVRMTLHDLLSAVK